MAHFEKEKTARGDAFFSQVTGIFLIIIIFYISL
jgi:hypothetical protein